MSLKKIEVLRGLNFGNQVAEEEKDTLRDYFVQTNPWKKIYQGDVDIVYGPKGSGKSAIYVLIQEYERELSKKKIVLVPTENLRGDPAFSALVMAPPTSEREFENLWKLYFLSLIGRAFQDREYSSKHATELIRVLSSASLLPSATMTLSGVLKSVQTYVRKYFNPRAVEGTIHYAENSGSVTGVTGRIVFDEPDADARSGGKVSINELFKLANLALEDEKKTIWLLLDRLDIAFDESAELEKNALRALFRAYRSIRTFDRIALKIFLRTDIWDRIADTGFREATHLSRDLTISWDTAGLKNLVIRRLVSNPLILKYYRVSKRTVLQNVAEQDRLFERVFPTQVEVGEKQSTTMDWLIKRTADGTSKSAPRELVLFLNALLDEQIARLERGEPDPPEEFLFDRTTFKVALPKVSEYRTTKVLYAEYPDLKNAIEALRSKKSEHHIGSLAQLWGKSEKDAVELAGRLVDIGFFEKRIESGTYWVPFIYRSYLNLIQGKATKSE